MPMNEVINAAPAALDAGETICVPGLSDTSRIKELITAELTPRRAAHPHRT
jgi:hypothetical protein